MTIVCESIGIFRARRDEFTDWLLRDVFDPFGYYLRNH